MALAAAPAPGGTPPARAGWQHPSDSGTGTGQRGQHAGQHADRRAGERGEPEVAGRIDGLQLPWSTVFLPDGTAVISERDSALLK